LGQDGQKTGWVEEVFSGRNIYSECKRGDMMAYRAAIPAGLGAEESQHNLHPASEVKNIFRNLSR